MKLHSYSLGILIEWKRDNTEVNQTLKSHMYSYSLGILIEWKPLKYSEESSSNSSHVIFLLARDIN